MAHQGSKTHLIDKEGYIVGVLLGWPRDHEGWDKAVADAFKMLQKALAYFIPRETSTHCRGSFPSIAHGISFGGGQQVWTHPTTCFYL
jgi:hypothetical protein